MADRRATGTELAAMRLGTELAAMRLALGVLRRAVLCPWSDDAARVASDVDDVLRIGGRETRIIRYHTPPLTRERIARLALYLRARLRMERGDLGRSEWCCPGCDWHHAYPVKPADFCDCDVPMARRRARITPLWQLASAHEATR